MSSVFGINYRYEQLFTLTKDVKSRTRTLLTDENLKGCVQIVKIEVKSDNVRKLVQNQCHLSHY
jgi:hypothetical protein